MRRVVLCCRQTEARASVQPRARGWTEEPAHCRRQAQRPARAWPRWRWQCQRPAGMRSCPQRCWAGRRSGGPCVHSNLAWWALGVRQVASAELVGVTACSWPTTGCACCRTTLREQHAGAHAQAGHRGLPGIVREGLLQGAAALQAALGARVVRACATRDQRLHAASSMSCSLARVQTQALCGQPHTCRDAAALQAPARLDSVHGCIARQQGMPGARLHRAAAGARFGTGWGPGQAVAQSRARARARSRSAGRE